MEKPKKIALAVAMLCCAGPALAQQFNPSWYIQPNVSAFRPDKDFGVDERDWGAGLRFGKAVSPNWDLQFGASHARANDDPFRYRQTLAGVDALLMISRSRFRPFILFGLGAERDKVDNPLRQVRKTSPYATAGIGFQLGLTDQLSMQLDLRTVAGRLRDDAQFGFGRSNNRYLTLGLNWAFNKPPAPPPPPAPPEPVVQTPPPAPPAPPPPAAPVIRFEKVTLSSTELFDFNSAKLRLPQPKLDEVVAALTADPTVTDVDITGYADRIGKPAYNLALSEKRANAVRNYLVAAGIDGARLKAYGKGEANPVVVCNNKRRADLIQCLEPNRRVEIEQITINKRVP